MFLLIMSWDRIINWLHLLPASVRNGAGALVAVIGVSALARSAESWAAGVAGSVAVKASEVSRAQAHIAPLVTRFLYSSKYY